MRESDENTLDKKTYNGNKWISYHDDSEKYPTQFYFGQTDSGVYTIAFVGEKGVEVNKDYIKIFMNNVSFK